MNQCVRVCAVILCAATVACGSSNNAPAAGGEGGGQLSGTIRVDGSSTVFPISEAVAEEFVREHPNVRPTVAISGTGGGFQKFCRGETDISDASRPIRAGDEPVNRLHIEVDERCFRLLALYQPMATDLRAIVAAVKINSDLERVGDLAVNIAEAATRYVTHPPVKKLIDIPRMGDIAQSMLRDALDAYVKRDTALAHHVLNEDDQLDALKTQVFRELLTYMLHDPATVEPAHDLILISRHLERIGDHATNIAEDVIFMVSALDVRHHPPRPVES